MDTLLAKLDRIGDSRHALSLCEPGLGMDAPNPGVVHHPDPSLNKPDGAPASFIDSPSARDEGLKFSPDQLMKP